MKRVIYVFLTIFYMMCFSSCKTSYWMDIETRELAKITFPSGYKDVVFINNTLSQPTNYDLTFILNNDTIKDGPEFINDSASVASLDYLSWYLVDDLSWRVAQENYFNSVSVYELKTREGRDWLSAQATPLPPDIQTKIYDEADADIIISLDKMVLHLTQSISSMYSSKSYPFVDGKIVINVICSTYSKDNEKAFATFSISDSLLYKDFFYNDPKLLFNELPFSMFETQINEISGNLLTKQFTPGWKESRRRIYTDHRSRMQEAVRYAEKGSWEQAANLWKNIYNSENNLKKKSQLAMNIATAYELQDQLKTSLDWLMKGYDLIKDENEKKFHELQKIYLAYITILGKRIEDNELLNKQLGTP